MPFGGEIVGGWFVRRFDEYSGGSGFFWTIDRKAILGGNVQNADKFEEVIFADGSVMNINKLNDPRGKDQLAMYTWHYGEKTDPTEPGVEVDVLMSNPTLDHAGQRGVPAESCRSNRTSGGTPLRYDHVVLSAHGKAAEELRKLARPGSRCGQPDVDRLRQRGHRAQAGGLAGRLRSIPETQYLWSREMSRGTGKPRRPGTPPRGNGRVGGQGSADAGGIQRSLCLFSWWWTGARSEHRHDVHGRGHFCRDYLKADLCGEPGRRRVVDDVAQRRGSQQPVRQAGHGQGRASSDRCERLLHGGKHKPSQAVERVLDQVARANDRPTSAAGPGPQFGLAAKLAAGQEGTMGGAPR